MDQKIKDRNEDFYSEISEESGESVDHGGETCNNDRCPKVRCKEQIRIKEEDIFNEMNLFSQMQIKDVKTEKIQKLEEMKN